MAETAAMDKQSFFDGRMFDAYQYMGGLLEKGGARFCTFAPMARKVGLVGDFSGWEELFLEPEAQSGFWSLFVPGAKAGQLYKYRIYTSDTEYVEHTDPYAFAMEKRPACCAILTDLGSYKWQDEKWMAARNVGYDKPVNIYEMHLGSWKRKGEEEDGWYTYEELAGLLVPYLVENGYTHVEFMPLSEHPFDGSWGYQNTGFFAATSRYGTPQQLMALVDALHAAGIGAILDIVPVHFAVDSYGLGKYDGTALYEYPDGDVSNSEWGSYNFIYARREARCFMQSCASFWLEKFHFDGLRLDAVSRLIYWQGDENRGVNENSLAFLRNMNAGLKSRHPSAMLIAEDSSTYPGVTKPVAEGGLGFDYKWDLGWMHDTLQYFQTAPEYRGRDYHKLTFSMMYFYTERYLLELSHDENVHGKATILQKMHGDYEDKFPQGRAMYLYMMLHPGKKLNFMGAELGQLREWTEEQEQDWMLLDYPVHDAFHKYMVELNRLYKACKPLHVDYSPENFEWLDCHAEAQCIYAIGRAAGGERVAGIFNFSDKARAGYTLPLAGKVKAKLLLHTDWQPFGGSTDPKAKPFTLKTAGGKTTLTVDLPRYSGMVFALQ